jgi:cytochrome c biogenesis protein ResB
MKKILQILMLIAIFSIIGGILQAQVDPPCNPVTNVETSKHYVIFCKNYR